MAGNHSAVAGTRRVAIGNRAEASDEGLRVRNP